MAQDRRGIRFPGRAACGNRNRKNNQEIAQQYYLSIHTVKSHIENIFKKMRINKRASLFNIINEIRNTL